MEELVQGPVDVQRHADCRPERRVVVSAKQSADDDLAVRLLGDGWTESSLLRLEERCE